MSLALVTLVSKAAELRYPIVPVLDSALPIVDEIIVNIDVTQGMATWDLVCKWTKDRNLFVEGRPAVRLLPAWWDWDRHDAGKEFVRQTNRAFENCTSDWILNLQADEVLHEDDYDEIRWITDLPEDYTGAQLNRLYFWRDLQTIRTDWTQPLVRMVRRGRGRSAGDSIQCEVDGLIWPWQEEGARIFHYTRIGDPADIGRRVYSNDLMHHSPEELDPAKPYDFRLKTVDGHLRGRDATLPTLDDSLLVPYDGTHPKAMEGWAF